MGVLENWVKIELQELFTTAIILVLIGASFEAAVPVATALTGNPNYQSAAISYLDSSIIDMSNFFMSLTKANYLISKAAGFSYSGSLSGYIATPFISEAPKAGLSPLIIALSGALDNLGNTILLMDAQKMLLIFFLKTIPAWFFPLGVLLRLVPNTRKIGAAILSLSIGGFLIFPWALIIDGEIYKVLQPGFQGTVPGSPHIVDPESAFGIQDIGEPPGIGVLCNKAMPAYTIIGEYLWSVMLCSWLGPAAGACSAIVHIIYYTSVAGFQISFTSSLQNYASSFNTQAATSQLYGMALPGVTQRVVVAIALTLFSAIMTIILTRNISIALGGEGQLYGLSKII